MAEDSDEEKTESPSDRRLERAREEGNIPRSRELSSVLMLVAMASILYGSSQHLKNSMFSLMQAGLSFNRESASMPQYLTERFAELIMPIAKLWIPMLFGIAALVAIANILVGGWYFNPNPLMPKFDRVNPFKGLMRLFSKHSLEELVKAMIKSGWLAIVAVWLLIKYQGVTFTLGLVPSPTAFYDASAWLGEMFMRLSAALLVIVFIEVPWVLYSYYKSLRMTKQEVRDESKESDGDPHIKARIRQLQREAARKRMMTQVPKANVVIVNPTRYAVALRYEASMAAPQIVAKGMGRVAQRIRDIATENKISIVSAPPVARALYYHGDLDRTIPATLFSAVAEVLAYVYQMEEAITYRQPEPLLPTEWSVPQELDVEDTGAEEDEED